MKHSKRQYRLDLLGALFLPYTLGSWVLTRFAWPYAPGSRAGFLYIASATVVAAGLAAECLTLHEYSNHKARDRGLASGLMVSLLLLAPAADALLLFANRGSPDVSVVMASIGFLLFAAGTTVRFLAKGHLGSRFSHTIQITPGHTLATSGPYRYVRHPAYLGTFLVVLGCCVMFGSWLAVAVVAALSPLGIVRIRHEERILRSEFGAAFEQYAARVKMVIPFLL